MTYNNPKKEMAMNTETILKVSFSDTASSATIFDAYHIDYKLKLINKNRKSKLKNNSLKSKRGRERQW